MKIRGIHQFGILLSAVLLVQTVCEPFMAFEMNQVQAAGLEEESLLASEVSGVTVTTPDEFITALSEKQSPITITGLITIGDQADSTGKMYPVEIPEGTVIQGVEGASIDCRCPIQLAGDGVTIKDIEMVFSSSDALGSVPHREIFLAGHSLTLDNVSTYLEGSNGSLGVIGGTEEELLPSIYAGGFENTTVGTAASLTIQNANSNTMFQGIYMSHDAGDDSKVPYTGAATLNLGPKVTVRDGIFTETNSIASVEISGDGNTYDLAFYGNAQTTLTVKNTILYRTSLYKIGTLVLDESAQLELQQGSLENVILQKSACLDLNTMQDVVVNGDFTGGAYDTSAQVDETGIIVLNIDGSMSVQGTVRGTTLFHTENRSFPGEYTPDKLYITAPNAENTETGFILPESKAENYEMVYENQGWTVYSLYVEEVYPVVGSIEILNAPMTVDISKIVGSGFVPAETAPYCNFVWKDEDGNVISVSIVEELGLYYNDTIIGIKTGYWQDKNVSEQTDWSNVIQFVTVEETPGQYYFYADQTVQPKTGSYTFLCCSEYCEGNLNTVADVRALKDKIKAEFTVVFYDSSEEDTDTVDIASEEILVGEIDDQLYTGSGIEPVLTVKRGDVSLIEGQDYQVTYENNINVGTDTAKAIITGIGSYHGSREITFSILKSDPLLTLTVNDGIGTEIEYGQELTFKLQIAPYVASEDNADYVKFYYGEILLGTSQVESSGQAVLSYQTTEQKLPVGECVVRAVFDGTADLNQSTAQAELVLAKKTIASEQIASVSLKDFTGDGSTKTTELLSVADVDGAIYSATGEAELPDAAVGAYNVAKINNWALVGENADWYKLPDEPETIAVSPAVNILEDTSVTPDPEPVEKEGLRIKAIEAHTYTGKAIKPTIQVYEGETLLTKKDYTVIYTDNVNAGTATVTVKGRGNYSGSDTTTFVINPKDIAAEDITVKDVYAFIQNGTVKNPKVTVKFGKKTLKASTETVQRDYKFEWPGLTKDAEGNVIEQSHKITITGLGNYTGTRTFNYDVIVKETKLMSKVKITPEYKAVDYFNAEMPSFTLTYGSGSTKETLTLNEDYTISYPETIVPGKNTVTFAAKEGSGFYGTKTYTITVKGKSISAKDILIEGIKSNYDFNGSEIRVGEDGLNTLVVKDTSRLLNEEPVILEENVDYTLSYTKNINAGTATVILTGKGGYTGKKKVTFKIDKIMLTEDFVTISDSAVYTKNGAKATVSAMYKEIDLVEKKDYKVSYRNNKVLGENSATIIIVGKGNFKGEIKKNYNVVTSDKEQITFTVTDTLVPATVARLKPKMSIIETSTKKKLAAGKDYEKKIEYYVADGEGGLREIKLEDLKSGTVVTARLTIVNDGFYDPDFEDDAPITIDTTFRLYSVKASTLIVDAIPNQTYTGKEIEPALVVKRSDGTVLTEYDEETKTGDYIVTYTNNKKVGKAKATITCVNQELGGKKTVTFRIIKKPMQFKFIESLRSLFF